MESPALFLGDLDDPWIAMIADALPRGSRRLALAGELPEECPEEARGAGSLVLQRAFLTDPDAETLRRWRTRPGTPGRVVVCVGPHTRFQQVERWAPLVEAILPEAIAAETIARHVEGEENPPIVWKTGTPPAVAVVSSQFDLRQVLAEACREAGYVPQPARDWSEAAQADLVIWDVPVLDEGWAEELARQAKVRDVVALLGFADRQTVTLARDRGAAACLDLPCDPADLAFVLDRIHSGPRRHADGAHEVPPPPAGLGKTLRRLAERPAGRG